MEYSAGLTSKLFWLQEARKTASYIADGLSKSEIRAIAWDENIYQVRAEYNIFLITRLYLKSVLQCPYKDFGGHLHGQKSIINRT